MGDRVSAAQAACTRSREALKRRFCDTIHSHRLQGTQHNTHLDSVFCSTGCLTREVVRRSREGLCLRIGPGRLASEVREDRRDAERFMDRLTSLLICVTCSMTLSSASG